MKAECGHHLQGIVQVGFGAIVSLVRVVFRAASPTVIERHDAAFRADPFGEKLEIGGVAGKSGETENRSLP
jgi:hypothetical protein